MGLSNQQVQNIPYEFKVLMDGDSFTYSTDLSVAGNTTINFHVKTGKKDVVINIAAADAFGAETVFIGFADSIVSVDGTEVFARNHNRNKSDSSETRLFTAPTITNDGTEINRAVAYAANQPGKVVLADAQILSKYILKKHSSNILRVTNRDNTNAVKISLVLDYVEVEL